MRHAGGNGGERLDLCLTPHVLRRLETRERVEYACVFSLPVEPVSAPRPVCESCTATDVPWSRSPRLRARQRSGIAPGPPNRHRRATVIESSLSCRVSSRRFIAR
jgi:hypothetical protein